MALSEIKAALLEAIREFEVIDCHEHLGPEEERTSQPVDVLNLFGHYTRTDLITAGMSEADFQRLHDHNYPLEFRWRLLGRYLPEIRFGSYARAGFIAAQELYGFDDINDDTYEALSAAMQERNQPGVYKWILREKCKIRCCFTQGGNDYGDRDLLLAVMRVLHVHHVHTWEAIQNNAVSWGAKVHTLEDYLEAFEQALVAGKQRGVVGIKIHANPYTDPDYPEAVAGWRALRTGRAERLALPPSVRGPDLGRRECCRPSPSPAAADRRPRWGRWRTAAAGDRGR